MKPSPYGTAGHDPRLSRTGRAERPLQPNPITQLLQHIETHTAATLEADALLRLPTSTRMSW
jgi:hypothetical protein